MFCTSTESFPDAVRYRHFLQPLWCLFICPYIQFGRRVCRRAVGQRGPTEAPPNEPRGPPRHWQICFHRNSSRPCTGLSGRTGCGSAGDGRGVNSCRMGWCTVQSPASPSCHALLGGVWPLRGGGCLYRPRPPPVHSVLAVAACFPCTVFPFLFSRCAV